MQVIGSAKGVREGRRKELEEEIKEKRVRVVGSWWWLSLVGLVTYGNASFRCVAVQSEQRPVLLYDASDSVRWSPFVQSPDSKLQSPVLVITDSGTYRHSGTPYGNKCPDL